VVLAWPEALALLGVSVRYWGFAMTDPTNVLTTENITSFKAAIAQANKSLQLIETKAKSELSAPFARYFQAVQAELTKKQQELSGRVEKMRGQIGKLSRTDQSVKNLSRDITVFRKRAELESKKQHTMRYMYGTTKVGSDAALQKKIEGALPASAKSYASQALSDAVKGQAKDAGKFGARMRYASAGKNDVEDQSCTLFFTRKDTGLDTILTVLAVGSHATATSYTIHKTFTPKLKEGEAVTL
jgi:hypothetical protein